VLQPGYGGTAVFAGAVFEIHFRDNKAGSLKHLLPATWAEGVFAFMPDYFSDIDKLKASVFSRLPPTRLHRTVRRQGRQKTLEQVIKATVRQLFF
jgi:hypothetical protein